MNAILNGILSIYFLIMTVIYPLYMKDGYYKIADAKFYFFRDITLLFALPVLLILWLKLLNCITSHKIKIPSLSPTDLFMCGYGLISVISYLFTSFREEALWGTDGWYMGLCTQLMFIGIYFLFSRYLKHTGKLLYPALGTSFLVFLLGILNRYSVYPIEMRGQKPGFISTMGNINWFCGYLAVIAPLGILWYWARPEDKHSVKRFALALYAFVSFLAGVVQGSSSVYLMFAVVFLLMSYHSFESNVKMFRFLELIFIFSMACQIARILRHLPWLMLNYEDTVSSFLTDTNFTLFMGMFIMLSYIMLKKYKIQLSEHKKLRYLSPIIGIGLPVLYVFILILNTCLPDGLPVIAGHPAFTFNGDFANGRGSTWAIGLSAFLRMSPLQKLIGIGPDCFTYYVYSIPDIAEKINSEFGDARLTNAHNEWLTMLINTGALGLACYAGISISFVHRCLKKAGEQPILFMYGAAVLSYMVHNMVSFQQMLNVPFVFLIIGIGEGICRKYNQ